MSTGVDQQATVRSIRMAGVPTRSKYVNKGKLGNSRRRERHGWTHGPVLFAEEPVRSDGAFIGPTLSRSARALGWQQQSALARRRGADILSEIYIEERRTYSRLNVS
jgi:hypothetical protein